MEALLFLIVQTYSEKHVNSMIRYVICQCSTLCWFIKS